MTASAVLDCFRMRMREDLTEEICNTEVTSLCYENGFWHVKAAEWDAVSRYVLFAAGGYAAPKLGTDGSAWKLLEKFGIPLVPPSPNLCPVLSDVKSLRPLKGLRVRGNVTLCDRGKAIHTEPGEVQFTEKALSGICVFNLSGRMDTSRLPDYALLFDPVPELGDDLENVLYTLQGTRCGMICEEMLTGLLVKPLARLLLRNAGIAPEYPCSGLNGREIRLLAAAIRNLRFPVQGLAGFEQAQSTRGGVPGSVLDAQLQVKGHPGLYVTGEAADVHADCGGYHLHWCWASGYAAAADIARKCAL